MGICCDLVEDDALLVSWGFGSWCEINFFNGRAYEEIWAVESRESKSLD